MRKFLTGMVLIGTLALAACETAQITDKIKEVQAYTTTACKFVPTLATITALFSQSAGASIRDIGSSICTAVTNIPLADGPGDHRPRVGKVVIRGTDLVTGKKFK